MQVFDGRQDRKTALPSGKEIAGAQSMSLLFEGENFEVLKKANLLALTVPSEYGGAGAVLLESCDVLGTIAQIRASAADRLWPRVDSGRAPRNCSPRRKRPPSPTACSLIMKSFTFAVLGGWPAPVGRSHRGYCTAPARGGRWPPDRSDPWSVARSDGQREPRFLPGRGSCPSLRV